MASAWAGHGNSSSTLSKDVEIPTTEVSVTTSPSPTQTGPSLFFHASYSLSYLSHPSQHPIVSSSYYPSLHPLSSICSLHLSLFLPHFFILSSNSSCYPSNLPVALERAIHFVSSSHPFHPLQLLACFLAWLPLSLPIGPTKIPTNLTNSFISSWFSMRGLFTTLMMEAVRTSK
jgi:hypothetical protein